MPKINLEIEAEPAQIAALNVYLGGKNTCLEFEISEHIESLYKKNVPKIVRDYISAVLKNEKNERRSEAI